MNIDETCKAAADTCNIHADYCSSIEYSCRALEDSCMEGEKMETETDCGTGDITDDCPGGAGNGADGTGRIKED